MSETIDKINALLALMKDNDVVELELKEKDFSVSLRKQGAFAPTVPVAPTVVATPAPAAPATPTPAAASETPAGTLTLTEIKSPIVGTFYRASNPDNKPFIEIGDSVKKDTVVCIIEAMKIMNEIKAEVTGVIEKVLVESGEPVEYGQPLFLVRRNA